MVRMGLVKGRPAVGLSARDIGNVESVEEADYQRKIDRGRAAFSSPTIARLFMLHVSRAIARKGINLKNGDPHANAKKYDDHINKILSSGDRRAKALTSGLSNLTGVTFSNELIRIVEEFGVAPRLVGITQMTDATQEWKRNTSGVTITYPAENTGATESSPTYDRVVMTVKEGIALTQTSRLALRSATSLNLADEILREHGQAWGKHIDDAYFKGDGTSSFASRIGLSHITGPAALFGTSAPGATDVGNAVLGGATASAHTGANLATLISRIFPQSAQNGAVITGSRTVMSDTFQRLGGATGGTNMIEFQGVKVEAHAGIPLIPNFSMNNERLDASGDAIDFFYGNFGLGSKIGYFGALEMDVSEERFFDQNAVALRSTLAWDLVIHDVGTSTTAGPIVSFWQT